MIKYFEELGINASQHALCHEREALLSERVAFLSEREVLSIVSQHLLT